MGERTRAAPRDRFVGPAMALHVRGELERLRAEVASNVNGHRQKALFKQSGYTVALFSFDEGGRLPEHSADGFVTIHAIEGAFVVDAEGVRMELKAGDIAMLKPRVPHDVTAHERGAFLLHVSLES